MSPPRIGTLTICGGVINSLDSFEYELEDFAKSQRDTAFLDSLAFRHSVEIFLIHLRLRDRRFFCFCFEIRSPSSAFAILARVPTSCLSASSLTASRRRESLVIVLMRWSRPIAVSPFCFLWVLTTYRPKWGATGTRLLPFAAAPLITDDLSRVSASCSRSNRSIIPVARDVARALCK